ncbi:uncharacterized protein LOC126673141 isoform X2 [Mercurialis annua]|uniref:uncharacterized protein LOC126673141 isoform X2 n=1 Tax=Mercurialis annua TaxID=3986 RepID=UPI00215ED04D|nr:uncharacterized protein LOC126673141 isoform X2 [Mercurialis annua]
MVMDESFFGEFTFAPSNHTVHSNPSPINGRDSSSVSAAAIPDDDDWGDFIINSGGLAHTQSLPRFSKPLDHHQNFKIEEDSSELDQPGSAPGRFNSGSVQWEKPKGALPLSIFGFEEEEEEETVKSGGDAASFTDYSKNNNNNNVNKGSGLIDVNDLIVNLYNNNNKQNDFSKEVKLDSQVIDSNGENDLKSNLDWDPLNVNLNKERNSVGNGASLGFDSNNAADEDEDDEGWEFKDAQDISKTNQVDTEIGMPSAPNVNGFGANWNDGWNLTVNGDASSLNSLSKSPVDGNDKELDNAAGDDGWEYMGSDSKLQVGDDKVKTKHVPAASYSMSLPKWDVLFSDSSRVEVDEKHFNGNSTDEKDSGGSDEWDFKGAETVLQMKTENSLKLNSNWANSTCNGSSLDGSMHTNLNGMNLDEKQENLNLFGKSEDFGDDDGWEFTSAEAASRPGDRNTKDDGRMPENLEGAAYRFGFGSGVQVSGDLLGASQETSQKSGESNFEFDFDMLNENNQNDTVNGFHIFPVNGKVGSDENSWPSKDAFSEIGSGDKEEPMVLEGFATVEASIFDSKFQGNKVIADNHKGALPLSIFGDEEKETDHSVIHQDISTQMSTNNLRDSVKNPHLDMSIKDLISSLYCQAEQNDSVNNAQNLSENGLDSDETATASELANANPDPDDDSWEFQDAATGAEVEDPAFVLGLGESHTKYSNKEELNDYVQFFSKLKEKLQFAAVFHFENLKKAQNTAALAGEDADVQALDKKIQDIKNEIHQDSIFSSEIPSDNHSPGDASLSAFIEILREPNFRVFESEYQLSKKLELAENNLRSAIELLKYVASTLQILKSVSKEGQSNYISAWFKMLFICLQELRHGAFIWKQALQENVHDQLLTNPRGKLQARSMSLPLVKFTELLKFLDPPSNFISHGFYQAHWITQAFLLL